MATITVRGTAAIPVEPDEATVALTLSALHDSPEAAYRDISDRSQELERLFDELAIERAQRSTAGVAVQPEWEYTPQSRQELRGYRASVRTLVRVRKAALVARLLALAVERTQAQVEGPYWTVDLENPARLEACGRAAAVAHRKAEAYAAALDVRLGALVEITEPGVSRPGARRGASFASVDAEVPVNAGEQSVTAAVELTYELAR